MLAEGYLGDLYTLTVRGTVPGFVNPDAPATWRQRQDRSGLNILNMGIWYEAVIRWVGPAANVVARSKIFVPQRQDAESGAPIGVDVPDHVNIIADLARGGQAAFEFSSVCGLIPDPGAWLCGSDGTLHYDQMSNKLYGGRRDSQALQEIDVAPEKAGSWRVEEEFIGAIRGEEEIHLTDFATAVKYMEFTAAVHKSAVSGQMVPVPE